MKVLFSLLLLSSLIPSLGLATPIKNMVNILGAEGSIGKCSYVLERKPSLTLKGLEDRHVGLVKFILEDGREASALLINDPELEFTKNGDGQLIANFKTKVLHENGTRFTGLEIQVGPDGKILSAIGSKVVVYSTSSRIQEVFKCNE